MVTLTFAFVLQALWLILSPYSLTITIIISLITLLFILIIRRALRYLPQLYNRILALKTDLPFKLSIPVIYLQAQIKQAALNGSTLFLQKEKSNQLLFFIIGLLFATPLYLSALTDYRTILESLPVEIEATYRVIYNNSPYSTTIEIVKAHNSEKSQQENQEKQSRLLAALKGAQLRIYSLPPDIKNRLEVGALYRGDLGLRARFFRSMPGDQQRILRVLARKEIGYGKLISSPEKIEAPPKIGLLRQKVADIMLENYSNGAYMSALSVGKSEALTQHDWQILRETGTIHLVSISGLHLTLTAFYAFILFRILFALIGWRRPAPYKIAAVIAIGSAWGYALLAGMSLPTIRAAIMFSVAMLSLLIEKPIFTLNSVALALLIILSIWPLSLLTPGFWLSFTAVTILTLTARIVKTTVKGVILSQLIISLLLIPLTAAFFQEISLISPLINLFAIPWTSLMIMPSLLLGTLLLPFSQLMAKVPLFFTNQSLTILRYTIETTANLPFAAVETTSITLEMALIATILALYWIAHIPKIQLQRNRENTFPWLLKDKREGRKNQTGRQIRNRTRYLLIAYLLGGALFILCFSMILFDPPITDKPLNEISITSHQDVEKSWGKERLYLYQLPVGEGLSFYLQLGDYQLLYDSGNRFGAFDAGRDVIVPFLKRRGINHLTHLILTQNNQQHIGGTRSLREAIPVKQIFAHRSIAPMIDQAQECQRLSYRSKTISIEPIKRVHSSCAYRILYQDQLLLYLLSDISQSEWRHITHVALPQDLQSTNISQLILLYPNQGRSRFNIDLNKTLNRIVKEIPKEREENNLQSTILLSTKFPQKALRSIDNIEYYNGYFGAIEMTITPDSASQHTPRLDIQIKNYADSNRYWWVKYHPSH